MIIPFLACIVILGLFTLGAVLWMWYEDKSFPVFEFSHVGELGGQLLKFWLWLWAIWLLVEEVG